MVGYYDHFNLGDEQYKTTFCNLFKTCIPKNMEHTIDFIDCDKLKVTAFDDDDVIVLGGGDVLNDYFLDKIIAKFGGSNNKIIAISVGLPFTSTLIDTTKLNIIDYIFVRTQQDISLFMNYFHPHRVRYIPDISYFLVNEKCPRDKVDEIDVYKTHLKTAKEIGKKIVSVSLSRHIYDPTNPTAYDEIKKQFAKFFNVLTSKGYHILFLPFNTKPYNHNENDIIIHRDILHCMLQTNSTVIQDVTFVDKEMHSINALELLGMCNMSVTMRFHACLFSIYKCVPILPIFTTRKCKNLMLDTQWPYYMELNTDWKGIPTKLDYDDLVDLYEKIIDNEKTLIHSLQSVNVNLFHKELHLCSSNLLEVLTSNDNVLRQAKTFQRSTKPIDTKIQEVYSAIQSYANEKGYLTFRDVTDSEVQDIIVSIVSFYLTNGCINSPYNYGLKMKMFKNSGEAPLHYDHIEEWKWIVHHHMTHKEKQMLPSSPHGLFNIGFIDQVDYSGTHRSGWQYVYDNIKHLHNSASNLLLDLYVDRTFHWNVEIAKLLKIVPYTQPWMGFVHHTFDTTFSSFNCYNLLASDVFLKSLKHCKGLIVLSQHLKDKFDEEFNKLGLVVPVYVLCHPTEINVEKWSIEKFRDNNDKKIIHVGGWLRNIYSFYKLNVTNPVRIAYGFLLGEDDTAKPYYTKTEILRKIALKGKSMNNYYPSKTFLNDMFDVLSNKKLVPPVCNQHCSSNVSQNTSQNTSQNISQSISQNTSRNTSQNVSYFDDFGGSNVHITNNWYRHFFEDLNHIVKSVDYIEFLENDDYDKLLTENIIYINVVDASAVNTVIECMARCTPIIVNKCPPVVELLGEDYPLYINAQPTDYHTINMELAKIMRNPRNILRAHRYLCNLDNTKINIQTFVDDLTKTVRHAIGQ